MSGRHLMIFSLDETMLRLLFTEGATVRTVQGVPADAVFLGVQADWARRAFVAMYEHPSFPLVPPGLEPPTAPIGADVLVHPQADRYDLIPLRISVDAREYLDMKRWICERAAEYEGREYNPRAQIL